jgi:RNA polymerase sigma-70 factor (ECF subfamily)
MPLTAADPANPSTLVLDPARLRAHLPRLTRIAFRLTGSPDAAEDLVQDTLERLLRAPRTVSGDDFRYLARALRNTHIDRHRAQQRRVRAVTMDDALEAVIAAPDRTEERATAHAVLAAVAGLPAHYRDAVTAVDVAGLSYEEAARSLGVPVGTIMSRLYRGRRAVIAAVED